MAQRLLYAFVMKTLLTGSVVVLAMARLLSAPALADDAGGVTHRAEVVPSAADDDDAPAVDAPPTAHVITDQDVARVIHDEHEDQLEYCWLRAPAEQRTPTTASLHLAIAAAGTVTTVRITGELPALVGECLTSVASHWQFPAADAAVEIDHAIRLSSVK